MEKLKDGWAVELRRQKEAWGAAERVKREAWLAEKTAEVKELTIKARLGHMLLVSSGKAGSPRMWEGVPCLRVVGTL